MSDKRPTIKAVLYRWKILTNGECPIMLQICYNGQRKYKSLGISCPLKDWNKSDNSVRRSNPNYKLLNKAILTGIHNAQSAYLNLENGGNPYSVATIVQSIDKSAPSKMTLFKLFDNRVRYFREITETNNTADGYQTLENAFKKYLNQEDVELFVIDAEWIQSFESWLKKRYKDTSIKKFFDCFKAAMNYAVKMGDIEKSPLDGYEHIKKLNLSTKKRALSMDEMTKLMMYYVESYGILGEKDKPVAEKTKTHYWNKKFRRRETTKLTPIDAEKMSLALFLCSYCFQGLALVDMAKLKWKDLQSIGIFDTNQYAFLCAKYGKDYAELHREVKQCYQIDIARSKTGKPVKIVVEQGNVNLYLNPFYPDSSVTEEERDEMYIFPIYSEMDDTEAKKYGRMKYAIYLVNVNLKRIGDALGIPNLTFYAARHTYASNLYHADVSTSLIAQNMGRSPAEIETYLKSFEQSKILEANNKMFITGQQGFKEGLKAKPVDANKRAFEEKLMAKNQSEVQAIIDKYGSVDAYNAAIQKEIDDLEAELDRKFGDDVNAKFEYLKNKQKSDGNNN